MRGRGGRSYYRGSSRGSSWGGSRGGYMGQDGGGGRGGRYMSGSDRSFDSRNKYGGSERFSSRPSHSDEYKSYRSESSYMGRESGRRSPERKRIRMEGSSSRHENSYTSSSSYRHDGPPSSYHERSSRGYSDERHGPSASSAPYPRRDDFRSPRGSYRGRLSSSRGARGTRDRPRRRLMEASYSIRRRLPPRMSEFGRRAKISRLRSMVAERRAPKRRLSERMDSDEEKKEDGKEGESGEEKSPKKDGSEKDDAKSDSGDDKQKKGGFIKLHCVHCGFKSLTFRRYEIHLRQKPHIMAMRRLSYKQKAILSQMRQAQRSTQNELEKEDDDLTDVTHYCLLCKLNYKQKKSVHQLSESHKNMKKFLMPTCKVCSINFKSPMSYEAHLCSIDHMKTKQRSNTAAGSDSGEDNELENFTTIDSVGGGDDGSDADEAAKEEKEKKEKKQSVCVGIEQIRTIQAHYCDLCKMYLPRGDDDEISKIISRHCKMRIHMQRYVRHKERQALEKKAEKLQRKELAEKQGKSGEDGDSKVKDEKKDDGNGEDDKLWADVDKDLGDILAEAETGNKSSDEDEEDSHVNGERYDRFKLSEKLDDDKIMKEDEESILDTKPELKEKLAQ